MKAIGLWECAEGHLEKDPSCRNLNVMKNSGDGWETYKLVTNAMGIWQAKQKKKSVPHYYSPARGPTFLKLAQGRFSFIEFIKMLVKVLYCHVSF